MAHNSRESVSVRIREKERRKIPHNLIGNVRVRIGEIGRENMR